MTFFKRNKNKKGNWDSAGFFGFYNEETEFVAHFLVCRQHWSWGYTSTWYDGPWYWFGLGPLFLICWRKW